MAAVLMIANGPEAAWPAWTTSTNHADRSRRVRSFDYLYANQQASERANDTAIGMSAIVNTIEVARCTVSPFV